MAVLLYGYVSNDLLERPVKPTLEIAMVYLVFATAAILLWVRHVVNAVVLTVVVAAALALFSDARAYALLAYFIITIVHVLLFTAAFVLHGALKRQSGPALVSLGVFAACIASFFLIRTPPAMAVACSHVELLKQYHRLPNAYDRPVVNELGRLSVTLFFVLSGGEC